MLNAKLKYEISCIFNNLYTFKIMQSRKEKITINLFYYVPERDVCKCSLVKTLSNIFIRTISIEKC